MSGASGPVAFVLTGGGSLGAVQVGMLQALTEAGLRPDFIVGASVGALNAAYFAGAPDMPGLERLADIWCGLRRADVFPLSLTDLVNVMRGADSLTESGRLRHLLERNLAFARIEEAVVPLHVMATDHQGMGVRFSEGPVLEAILASAAIPGIFPPVTIDGRALVDGAIAADTPLRVAADLGATRIVVLPTGHACAMTGQPKGVVAQMLHAVTLLISWRLIHEIEVMPKHIMVHLAPALCPLDISPYDFSVARQLIDRARDGTRAWLEGGGLTRTARPDELVAHNH